MTIVTVLVGLLIVCIGLVCMARPNTMLAMVDTFTRGNRVYLVALLRLILGAILVAAAPTSRLPAVIGTMGVLFLIAAALVGFMPRARIDAMVVWARGFSPSAVRVWSVAAMAMGGIIIYAA
ncbi:MAG: hypothetical protein JRG96_05055 [Deltaproteobacteria bacterium]|nr:hypothetical protein [Deltaproteobacteria bacterium]MBW2417946.1 hypothetical protein [Deltaproteobacteria bacterium]